MQRGLYLLLLLSVWQGPLPWLHSHSTLIDPIQGQNLWLLKHLEKHHADCVVEETQECLGWHLHIFFPHHHPESEQDEHSPAPQKQFRVGSNGAHLTADLLRLLCELSIPDFMSPQTLKADLWMLCQQSSRIACFYETFATELPLPLRFCVIRC